MRLNWIVIAAIVFSMSMSLAGCETMKGAAHGFGQDVENTPKYAKGIWDKLKEADAWVQKNLW